MNINHHGQETIKATEDTVWAFITNSKNVSQCLPDVDRIEIKDDHNFDAYIGVQLGPVRGILKFAITLEPHREHNNMVVNMQGGGPGVTIHLNAHADVIQQSESTMLLNWKGQADLRGPATIMGGKMMEQKAKDIIAHVFREIGKNINASIA